MNKQNNMKGRQRGRSGGGKPRPQGRSSNFDGSSNNNRMRGNAQQLLDKYLLMARDATSTGDRVLAENYFQHADHYFRVVYARLEQQSGRRDDRGGHGQGNGEGNNQSQSTEYNDQPPSQLSASEVSQSSQASPPAQYVQSPAPDVSADIDSAPSSNADIGLPPGILGTAALAVADETDAGQGIDEGKGKTVSDRPKV